MKEKIRVGFEGDFQFKEIEIAAGDPAPWDPSQKFSILGGRVPRLDGKAKATGEAKYPSDVRLPGMLYARILRCPYAAATVKSIDLVPGRTMPGVKAALALAEPGEKMRFAGQEVAAIAADTPERAEDAVRAIKVVYEPRPFVVGIDAARKPDAPLVFEGKAETKSSAGEVESRAKSLPRNGNVLGPRSTVRGNVEDGFRKADKVVETTYTTQVQTHTALETHGLMAHWEGDELTVYASTQGIFIMRDELAESLKIPVSKVRVLTDYMGGGFGAKFGPRVEGVAAARLAKMAGAPVRLFLERKEEQTATGNRPSSVQTIKLGATKDGKLTAMQLTVHGTGGTNGGTGTSGPIKNVYACENLKVEEYDVFTNAGPSTAMRAPGHPQGAFALEAAMDELALALGMDPLELRLKNDPSAVRREQFRVGAEKIGWKDRDARRKTNDPYVFRGVGFGAAVWYNTGDKGPRATVHIHRDGSTEVEHGGQDLGTGARTMIAIVAAEELGVPLENVSVSMGDTRLPFGPDSGGSSMTPSTAPTIRRAAYQAKLRPRAGDRPRVEGGSRVRLGRERPGQGQGRSEARRLLGRGLQAPAQPGRLGDRRARRQPRGRLEAVHDRRAVRRGSRRHGDRQGEGRARRRHPRLRRSDQRPHDREPDPGGRPPGRLLRALRGPGSRPRQRANAQPQRRGVQDRRRPRLPPDRRHARLGLGRNQQHQLGRHRRTVHRSDRGRDRQRGFARPRGADHEDSDHARGRARSGREGSGRPVMKPFTLVHARSLDEASRESARADAELKAGGVDLLDRMKEGFDNPTVVVSIAGVSGLDRIETGPPAKIGALATLASIAANPGMIKLYPALAAAAVGAATPQIRNMATLGGNLCQRPRCWYYRLEEFDCRKKGGSECFARDGENRFHAIYETDLLCCCVHPSATGTALSAYGASLDVVSTKGKRTLPIDQFFYRPTDDATRENNLKPGEIIESVSIPTLGPRDAGGLPEAQGEGVLRLASRRDRRRAVDRRRLDPERARLLRLGRAGALPLEGSGSRPQRLEARAGNREASGRGGGERREAPVAERLQGPTRAHRAGAGAPGGLRLNDDPLGPMRRFAKKNREADSEPDPFLCRYLRTKTWFAPDAFGEGDPRQSPSTAQYWCLRTMRPSGPDGDLVLPEACTDERVCFEPAVGKGGEDS